MRQYYDNGSRRILGEMATGLGKTVIASISVANHCTVYLRTVVAAALSSSNSSALRAAISTLLCTA
jgi:hypothetical protein